MSSSQSREKFTTVTTATSTTTSNMKALKFMRFLEFSLVCIILFLSPKNSISAKVIESVPGYPGNLPFRLDTDYIGAGEEEEVQLFYYFVESERDSKTDPLLLWLTGGPAASGLSTLVSENGPLHFNFSDKSLQSEIPDFQINPYSWTKVASIVYIDQPPGCGFSYSTTSKGYYSDDYSSARQSYEFLKKWLQEYVEFQDNPVFIAGESYAGIVVPMIVQEIINGNKGGHGPYINIKGYILGNPATVADTSTSRYNYAHRVSLISDELYEETREICHGDFDNVDPSNTRCQNNLQIISSDLYPVNMDQILEPNCKSSIPPNWWRCHADDLFEKWANNMKVQEDLHVRKNTVPHWTRLNRTVAYTATVKSCLNYHRNLTEEFDDIHALIYSGDQDMVVPYVNSMAWIRNLSLPITSRWKPWFFTNDHQVGGYTTKYSNGRYHLTFATVKGAGHTAPEFKSKQTLVMFTKWLKMMHSP